MKLKKHVETILLILAVLIISSGICLAGQPLIFGSTSKIEPFAYETNNTIKGFYFDVFDEISKRSGIKVEYKLYPFKRMNNYLKNGNIDGTLCIYYKKERESYLNYSKNPMITSRALVFVPKGKEFTLNSVKDLYNKQVGIIAGWSIANDDYNQAKKQGKIHIQEVAKYDQNLKKLMAGKLDCFIMTEQMTWYYANRMGISGKITALDMVFSEAKPFIAISKKSRKIKNKVQFMDKINIAFQQVIDDGTYDNLLKKYGVKNLN